MNLCIKLVNYYDYIKMRGQQNIKKKTFLLLTNVSIHGCFHYPTVEVMVLNTRQKMQHLLSPNHDTQVRLLQEKGDKRIQLSLVATVRHCYHLRKKTFPYESHEMLSVDKLVRPFYPSHNNTHTHEMFYVCLYSIRASISSCQKHGKARSRYLTDTLSLKDIFLIQEFCKIKIQHQKRHKQVP